MSDIWNKPGIYMAWPTTCECKPIYRGYKTKVNNQCTKLGKTEGSFASGQKRYLGPRGPFQGEAKFVPLAIIEDVGKLGKVEAAILAKIGKEFSRAGRAQEWFHTADRKRIKEIAAEVLVSFGIDPL